MRDTRQKYTEDPDGMIRLRTGKRMSKETYERRKAYSREYSKKNYAQFAIKIRKNGNEDVIERMREQESLTAFLVGLVRDNIKKTGFRLS